jgi:hypothetical protein
MAVGRYQRRSGTPTEAARAVRCCPGAHRARLRRVPCLWCLATRGGAAGRDAARRSCSPRTAPKVRDAPGSALARRLGRAVAALLGKEDRLRERLRRRLGRRRRGWGFGWTAIRLGGERRRESESPSSAQQPQQSDAEARVEAVDNRLVAFSPARERDDHRLVVKVVVLKDPGVAVADGGQGRARVHAERQSPRVQDVRAGQDECDRAEQPDDGGGELDRARRMVARERRPGSSVSPTPPAARTGASRPRRSSTWRFCSSSARSASS